MHLKLLKVALSRTTRSTPPRETMALNFRRHCNFDVELSARVGVCSLGVLGHPFSNHQSAKAGFLAVGLGRTRSIRLRFELPKAQCFSSGRRPGKKAA